MNVVKARAGLIRLRRAFRRAKVYGARAHGFDRRADVVAYVIPFGALAPRTESSLDWLEYGVRVGYHLTKAMTLDVFVDGVSGHDGIGTRVHGGAGLRVRF